METWLRGSAVGATFPLVLLAAHALCRSGPPAKRIGSASVLSALVLSLPFWLPPSLVVPRFFVSLVAVLGGVRVWETAYDRTVDGRAPRELARFGWYFSSVADLEYGTDHATRASARRLGALRVARGLLKGTCLLLLLWLLSSWPALEAHWPLLASWCLFAAFCAATGATDLLTGTSMLLSGHRAAEVFRSPLLSRSPIEFWSQRWNLMFRNSAYRLIFVPAGGRKRPVLGAVLVFLFSAVMHEYLVVAALSHTHGHMTLFFGLHGAATLLNQWARSRFRRRLPRPVGMTLTWALMVLTAPLFFAPLLQIFPLAWLRSWFPG